ncbi:hypothetical protein AVEN_106827-1 [Araneus ventricosus]|uniref:Secreted protein n=1 Tax=Araneus ventricosus TaxID=182803 RepID=A0A4Y2NMV5_ARAVE|nr:hypothetical protein AVEN_106827-1 [Araneus ventricosus]
MLICLIALNRIALVKMRLIYLSCSKWCPSATMDIWARDCTCRCTLYNMAGDTLAQASVIQFRSSVGGGVAYTRCLMYPHRKKSNGSGERGGHSTQPPYPMTCCWNVSRMYCWTLDILCGRAPSCWNHTFRRSLNGKSSRKSDITSFLFSFLPCYVALQFWELRTKQICI